MSITTKVSNLEAEVIQLRATNESLTQSCEMLTEQSRRLQRDLMHKSHACDEAERAVAEVEKLIEGAANMLIAGITKIRASKTPLTRQADREPAQATAALLERPEYK